jgi:hypothetical protein
MQEEQHIDVDTATEALLEANRNEASLEERMKLRRVLDDALIEEEVKNQAVYYGIDEDEARERIEQNRQETAEGRPRTIWDEPDTSDQNGDN